MFPTKALAARVKWEPFFVAHNPFSFFSFPQLIKTHSTGGCLLLTIWNKDHLKLISHICEILNIYKSFIFIFHHIVVSISACVDEDNDDGGAIPRAD